MKIVVVDRPESLKLDLPGVQVISARDYLNTPIEARGRIRVLNLCRSYRYQSLGYYVSLVAEARGHHPLPNIVTLQDLRHRQLTRIVSEELDERVQKSLAEITSDHFELSSYFGRNLAERHRGLAKQLFNLFPAPFLKASFKREGDEWRLDGVRLLGLRDIPESHQDFVTEATRQYLSRRFSESSTPDSTPRFDLAILVNPKEKEPPSDEVALRKFARIGEELGLRVHFVHPDDIGRIAEFDALFIRETTLVNHHTYRFSRRAVAEGLVVIDDPESIIRYTNKVFVAEMLSKRGIPAPKSLVVHRGNLETAAHELGFPCVLKLPDGSFSAAVKRVSTLEELEAVGSQLLEQSELIVAQEFLPSDFDWRIGVLDRKPLYACRYWMAKGHWQIIARSGRRVRYGKTEGVAFDQVPERVIELALAAAEPMGHGLYGIDLKELGDRVVVIEVNDNPNLDSDFEDSQLGDDLYRKVLGYFLDRLEQRSEARPGQPTSKDGAGG